MIDLLKAALEVQEFLLHRQWRFCIIGGLAVARWGVPRLTLDVDLALLSDFGEERQYVEPLLNRFTARIRDADRFALENRVLLVSASNGVPVDIALAGIPFEQRMIERASFFEFAPDVSLLTCSAEDLVVLKAFADREQDWLAVTGILSSQSESLDWKSILEELRPLCALREDQEPIAHLSRLRSQHGDA